MENQNQELPTEQESVLENEFNESRAFDKETLRIGIRKARNTLLVVAGLVFLGEMIAYAQLSSDSNFEFGFL